MDKSGARNSDFGPTKGRGPRRAQIVIFLPSFAWDRTGQIGRPKYRFWPFGGQAVWGETLCGETLCGETLWGETLWGERLWAETLWGETLWGDQLWCDTLWGETL